MLYADALSYLSLYTNYERELRYPYDGWHMNLARVRALLEGLGNPEQGLRVIHLAGTKGKGSTAAMLEGILRAAGYRTGLFTSPHLLDFRERIMLSGEMVGEDEVARQVERLIPAARAVHEREELGPLTYFEILTALGFAMFAEAGVDVAVMEAGLGGRYDATSVCDPLVSILTPVSLDHTDILGSTREEIAAEKSIIIKPGRPAVIAPQKGSVYEVFSARCREVGAPEIRVASSYAFRQKSEDMSGQRAEIKGAREFPDLFIALPGEHQLINAATAITGLDAVADAGLAVSDEVIKRGLAALSWPGRFQRIGERPDIILDGAHNAESAGYLKRTVMKTHPGRRVIAVVGLGGDKDVEGFCRELGPALFSVVLTRSRAMKAVPAERIIAALAPFGIEVSTTYSVEDAMELALNRAGPDDVILVTGSFYVVAEAMQWRTGRE